MDYRCVRIYFKPSPQLNMCDDIVESLARNKVVRPDNKLPFLESETGGSRLSFRGDEAIRYGFAMSMKDANEEKFYLTGNLVTDEDINLFCKRFDHEKYKDSIETTLGVLDEAKD